MRRSIGVMTAEHIAVGVVENNKMVGAVRIFPEDAEISDALQGMPADSIAQCIRDQIEYVAKGETIEAVGVALPGVIRGGIIEDSPNLQQLKGQHIQNAIAAALLERGITSAVTIFNDADAMAAGLAATRGHLDRLIRVWTIGNGIGFGRYPYAEGVWEGGHSVVTLDPKERYCGCGGMGHLEGIMGHRAMRLRFLDMEPEEIFEEAAAGDNRCCEFVKLWHRALAAATANSVHMDGPGKIFFTGYNARFLDLQLLKQYLHEMVKMSPLQSYVLEIVPGGDEIAIIGAAVNAEQAAFGGVAAAG